MRIIGLLTIGVLLVAGASVMAQQAENQTVGTMAEVMTSMVYPAMNDIILNINRAPQNDKDWVTVQRDAILLAESGNVLMVRGRGMAGDWNKDAKMLSDAGAAVYQAAKAKDSAKLAALTDQLNASCTTCHMAYRPNVYPKNHVN